MAVVSEKIDIVTASPGRSSVTARFVSSGDTTTVVVGHDGAPEGKEGEGYPAGHREILGVFAAFGEGN